MNTPIEAITADALAQLRGKTWSYLWGYPMAARLSEALRPKTATRPDRNAGPRLGDIHPTRLEGEGLEKKKRPGGTGAFVVARAGFEPTTFGL